MAHRCVFSFQLPLQKDLDLSLEQSSDFDLMWFPSQRIVHLFIFFYSNLFWGWIIFVVVEGSNWTDGGYFVDIRFQWRFVNVTACRHEQYHSCCDRRQASADSHWHIHMDCPILCESWYLLDQNGEGSRLLTLELILLLLLFVSLFVSFCDFAWVINKRLLFDHLLQAYIQYEWSSSTSILNQKDQSFSFQITVSTCEKHSDCHTQTEFCENSER